MHRKMAVQQGKLYKMCRNKLILFPSRTLGLKIVINNPAKMLYLPELLLLASIISVSLCLRIYIVNIALL